MESTDGEAVHHTQPPLTTPPPRTPFYSQFPPPPVFHPSPQTYASVASTPPMLPKNRFERPPPPHRVAQHTLNVTRLSPSHNRFVPDSRERHTTPYSALYNCHARNVGNYFNSFYDGKQIDNSFKKGIGCYNCGEFNHIQANCT